MKQAVDWLAQPGAPFVPQGLVVGSLLKISTFPHVWALMAFGDSAPEPWGPGAWLLGEPCNRWERPLAGPFESMVEATQAWESSVRRRRAIDVESVSFGFRHDTSALFDPVILLRPQSLVMGKGSRVDGFVKIEGGDGVLLGDYVHIASFCHLNIGGGTLIMDEGSSAGSGARILSGSAQIGFASCSATHPGAVNLKTTTRIGKGATVFAGATVSAGCTLGAGAALGGGSFLRPHTDVPAGELWAGVPAVFKKTIAASRIRVEVV